MGRGGWVAGRWRLGVYAVMAVLVLAPVAAVRVPCLGDYLNHLARISILSRIGHTPALQAFYASRWKFVPYYGMDLPVLLLAKLVGIYQAGRIYVALCVLAPPVSIAVLRFVVQRRVGLMPALGFLFCYNHLLDRGFLNYLFSSALAVALFAGWIASVRMRPWLRLAVFSAGVMGLYLAHAFAFAEYCLLVAGFEIGRARFVPVRRVLWAWVFAALQAVPAVVIGALFGAAANVSAGSFTHYGTVLDKLGAVLSPFYFPAATGWGSFASLGTILLVVACVLVFRRRWRLAPALVGPAIAVALVGVVTPSVLFNIWGTDFRLPLLLVIVLLAGVSRDIPIRARASVLACAMVLVAARSADALVLLRRLDAQVAEMRQLVAHLPMGARLLVVDDTVAAPGRVAPVAMTGHLAMVAAIDRDAFVPFLFTATSALQPLPAMVASGSTMTNAIEAWQLQEGLAQRDPAGGPPPFGFGGHKYWLGWRDKFDDVLVERFGAPAGAVPAGLALVAREGIGDLYRIEK